MSEGTKAVLPKAKQGVSLRPAREDECAMLSDLCLRSKAVWGYDAAFLEACREELSIRPADLANGLVRVAQLGDKVMGIVQLAEEDDGTHLDKLFVDPAAMSQGLGRILLDWALGEAKARGADRLLIDADPGAAPFYARHGARQTGTTPSGSIAGRHLPRMEIALR